MKYKLSENMAVKFLQVVEKGTLTFADFTNDKGVPELKFAHCAKTASGIEWNVKHLPIIEENIYCRYLERTKRVDKIELTKQEKADIVLGCVNNCIDTELLERVFPLERKAVIGAVLYSGFDTAEITQGQLPALPDEIKLQYDAVIRTDADNWGVTAVFVREHIKQTSDGIYNFDYLTQTKVPDVENLFLYQQMTRGVVFFLA